MQRKHVFIEIKFYYTESILLAIDYDYKCWSDFRFRD